MDERTCAIEDCEKPHLARGWCNTHYKRWLATGDPLKTKRPERQPCQIDGCVQLAHARGWCDTHYERWRKHGDPLKTHERSRGTCAIDGCERPHIARSWCDLHYRRWKTHGDPIKTLRLIGDVPERLIDKITVLSNDCWQWRSVRPDGYANVVWGGAKRMAHRVIYELFVAPIPDDLELDHVCHSLDLACHGGTSCPHRRCVNPAHLELVTGQENCTRSRRR